MRSNLEEHAYREFLNNGSLVPDRDELDKDAARIVMNMLGAFCNEGLSGVSGPMVLGIFNRLASGKTLTPLSGEDWEWMEIHNDENGTVYQNTRCCSVFKDENGAYDIDSKTFWEWRWTHSGYPVKVYYSCLESRMPVTFPYYPPSEPILEYRRSDENDTRSHPPTDAEKQQFGY